MSDVTGVRISSASQLASISLPGCSVKLSVIVPTFNEEAMIAETLRRVVAVLAPCELIVADGCSADRTAEFARPFATVLALKMTRGAALNRAAAIATGEVLLFLHADTMLPMGAAGAIEGALREADVIGGAFRLRFDHPGRLP
ncbi:MAG: glycosyltransferase, partial [Gemmatimonadota bacterium]